MEDINNLLENEDIDHLYVFDWVLKHSGFMNDTPLEIRRKQRNIIMSKTSEERFEMCIQMIEDARRLVEDGIRISNPDISALDLKIEVFKRYYKNEFSPYKMQEVCEFIRKRHNINTTTGSNR